MLNSITKIRECSTATYVKTMSFINQHARLCMFAFGVALLAGGMAEVSQAQFQEQIIGNAVGNLFRLIEGAFGALIMVIAGIGAIVAAAMGAYKAAVGMLVVAVGAFILRALVSLFFGNDFGQAGNASGFGGSGGGTIA